MSGASPVKQRGNPSPGDVVRSVVVIGFIVLGMWLFGQLFTNTPDDPIRDDVDYAGTATSARQAATYPLLAPTSLPDGWRANGVRFEPSGTQPWHLGVLNEDDRYIGLEQEKLPAKDLLETYADGAEVAGTIDVAGTTWQVYEGPDKRITWTSETPEVSTLVTTSTAPAEDLERYVALLSAD